MSWIIKELLNNSLIIKENPDLDSDDFNNLIVLERKIKEMSEKELLSQREQRVIELYSSGLNIKEVAYSIGLNRITTSALLTKATNKVAFQLGGEFTDDGYVDYMKQKYKLNEEQVETLLSYMRGRFSRKLIRRINVKSPI